MNTFKGPILIIGVPRSGTKLLRDLINQNPAISIPVEETHFIPHLYHKYQDECPSNVSSLEKFFDDFSSTTFYSGMKKKGICLDKLQFVSEVDASDWSGLFEYILRFYGPKEGSETIFGDKTPSYSEKILFLKRNVFPKAIFIHIIRDPLDCCISAKKIWGKSLFQFAEMWDKTVNQVKKDVSSFPEDYLEIKYEDLLAQTELIMRQICAFIECAYSDKMLKLEVASENYGDTKNASFVVENNSKKYLDKLAPKVIKRIEEIAYEGMVACGYQPKYATSGKHLSILDRFLLKVKNAYNSLRFHIKEKGIWQGTIYCFKLHSLIRST